ncbi:MAG: isoprenyl transferase [Desulfopila sp.]|jgi:undecaprenyl diphosphate synthase|nr:isoprenyl transferase [Desulfopila sp.]
MPTDSEGEQTRLPRHVAIVMDGNGRWAEKRKKPRLYGHKVGASSVREIVEVAAETGIKILTLYAFSSENWKRPDSEVKGLMSILQNYLESELTRMLNNDIRLSCIGDLQRIPVGVRDVLMESIEKTKNNKKLILNLALSYGGQDEIVNAVKVIAEKCCKGSLQPADIDKKLVNDHLYTAGLPDPDLLIRTGGEKRLSNFLLWQTSYAEIVFTDVMWPDYRKDAFMQSLKEYQGRERRFGRTGAQLNTG